MVSERIYPSRLVPTRRGIGVLARYGMAILCALTIGLLWWQLAAAVSPYRIFGRYSITVFFALLVATYVLGWAIYFFLGRPSLTAKSVNCALSTGTLLLIFGLLESPVALGLVDYRTVISPPESFLVTQVKPMDNPGNLLDPELMHIHRPGQKIVGEAVGDLVHWLGIPTDRRYPVNLQYDGQGFRSDREIKQADVVTLGDSFLEGVLVPEGNLVSSQLKQQLGGEVANLAQSGYGPQQEFVVLRRFGIGLKPKLVIWFFFEGNDLLDVVRYESFIKNRETIISQRNSFSERSFLRNALFTLAGFTAPNVNSDGVEARRRAGRFQGKQNAGGETLYFAYPGTPLSKEELASLDTAQNTLLQARKLSADNGARFLLVYVPTKFRVYRDFCEFAEDAYGRSWQPNDLPSRMAAWSQANGISYLDLTPALKESAASGELVYFTDDGHWNSQGHKVAAGAIARFLQSAALITPGPVANGS